MKTRVNSRMFSVVAAVMGALAAAGCGVNMNYASDAGSAPVCATALDCDGLPHIECDGQWLCDPTAACVWNCLPQQDCKADADCEVWAQALDVACAGHAACENGKCGWSCDQITECMSDSDCPAGYACEWSDVPMPMDGDTAEPSNATKCAAPGLKCAVVEPGRCVKMQVACHSDTDCPPNQECVYEAYPQGGGSFGGADDATTSPSPKCGVETNGLKCIPGGVCMDKVTDIPCGSDAECPDGFHCEWYGGDDPTTGSTGASTKCGPPNVKCIAPPDGLCVRDGEWCVCAEYYQPVCGTDGQTYGNECFARCAGVGIASWGECGMTACTSDYECGPGGRCIMDPCPDCPECGMCAGHCEMRPACAWDYDCAPGEKCVIDPCPACEPGVLCIDGQCYGHCEPVLQGCAVNGDCAAGEFCDHTGYADAPGCCVPDASGNGCPAGYPYCYGVCRPVACPDIACPAIYCEYGYKVDPAGCTTCECNVQPPKCETFTDPTTGTTCTRCYNPDGSVSESCRQDNCWGAWLGQDGTCRTPADGVYPPECCAPKACTMDQPACSSDFDCRGGALGVCVSGCCQFPATCVETFAPCADDSMCPQGTACFDGACCYGLK